MRIIAGKAGRIAIKVPREVSRPTTDFVRQAIYSILGDTVIDARVLDLFAGSGALGLEALSRGARSCLFVETNRQACKTIHANLAKARLDGGRVTTADASAFLHRDRATYDLILADPPYWKFPGETDHIRDLLESSLIPPRLADGALFIAETSASYRPPESDSLLLADRREYGSTSILFFRKPTQDTTL